MFIAVQQPLGSGQHSLEMPVNSHFITLFADERSYSDVEGANEIGRSRYHVLELLKADH